MREGLEEYLLQYLEERKDQLLLKGWERLEEKIVKVLREKYYTFRARAQALDEEEQASERGGLVSKFEEDGSDEEEMLEHVLRLTANAIVRSSFVSSYSEDSDLLVAGDGEVDGEVGRRSFGPRASFLSFMHSRLSSMRGAAGEDEGRGEWEGEEGEEHKEDHHSDIIDELELEQGVEAEEEAAGIEKFFGASGKPSKKARAAASSHADTKELSIEERLQRHQISHLVMQRVEELLLRPNTGKTRASISSARQSGTQTSTTSTPMPLAAVPTPTLSPTSSLHGKHQTSLVFAHTHTQTHTHNHLLVPANSVRGPLCEDAIITDESL